MRRVFLLWENSDTGESESVSGDPETSSENDPSDGEEIFYSVIDFLKPKLYF
jgi:hypothetical protein